MFRLDKKREGKREQPRAEQNGHRSQTRDGTLERALFEFTHAVRHHSLRRRP